MAHYIINWGLLSSFNKGSQGWENLGTTNKKNGVIGRPPFPPLLE